MIRRSYYSSAIAMAAAALAPVRADFTPIPLAPESFNHDLVVEKEAIRAPIASTASMDGGSANSGFTWYEAGYNLDFPETGLPAAGSTVPSAVSKDHSYTFAADYTSNNALLVDTNIPSASLTLNAPASLAAISLLTSAGHGPVTNTVVVHYENGTSETATFVAPDWFGENAAVSANGRINAVSLAFDGVSSGNPNLYSIDIPLTQAASPVSRLEFQNGAIGDGHTAIFAVSGATAAGGSFTPLSVIGFNQDMVIEAGAPQPLTALDATTASMDAGFANTGYSWYERGYNTNALPTNSLATGLPAAGTTLTNVSAPDHVYVLPSSYTENNAILVDLENSGTIRFATPTTYSTLSFLTAAGNGTVTIAYTVTHEDGSTDTGSFVSPDWFNNANAAFIANGRVSVQSGLLDNVNGNNPRLYPADITLSNTNSPITTVDLSLSEGAGHAAVFAVSGAVGNVAPLVATQPASQRVMEGSAVQFTATASGTLPLTYRWQVETNGSFVDLQDDANLSGADSPTLTLNSASFAAAAQYRLAVTNISGSTFSTPATLTVLSSTPSVITYGDPVEAIGGSSPENEGVEHVVDLDTSKYLNHGTDGDTAAPFVGPAGFTVTPALGSDLAGTIVTAIRFYTANDAVERDPGSFTLEGSNDGVTFTPITSGDLALPEARNNAGPLDPLTQAVQEVRFANAVPYKSYRVLFQSVKNNATANSMQIGEVELLGTVATESAATLTVTSNADGTLTITSSAPGTLQSTTAIGGASANLWTDEGPINGSVTINTTEQARFCRVFVQQ